MLRAHIVEHNRSSLFIFSSHEIDFLCCLGWDFFFFSVHGVPLGFFFFFAILFCEFFLRHVNVCLLQVELLMTDRKNKFYPSLTWWTIEFIGLSRVVGERLFIGAPVIQRQLHRQSHHDKVFLELPALPQVVPVGRFPMMFPAIAAL